MSRHPCFAPGAVAGALALGLLAAGCDDRAPEKSKPTGSHVWRGQTDMYYEAKEVAKGVNAQLNAQEAAVERARRGD